MRYSVLSNRREFLQDSLVAGAGLFAASASRSAMAGDASPWDIGIYTRPWAAFDYRVALDEVAKAGFKHVGLMTTSTAGRKLVIDATISVEEAAQIGAEARQRQLGIPSVYGGGFSINRSLEEGVAGLKKLIDNCAAAGAKSLLLGGINNPNLFEAYFEAVKRCCDYAAEKKLPITIKPHGGLNATGKQCRKCIQSVGHESFSLWYDPGNIFFYSNGELDPVDDAPDVAGLVKHGMCVKDFDMAEKDGVLSRNVELTPGQGRVDFPAVLRGLQEGGFTSGSLVIECIARGDGSVEQIHQQAIAARKYVEQLVQTL